MSDAHEGITGVLVHPGKWSLFPIDPLVYCLVLMAESEFDVMFDEYFLWFYGNFIDMILFIWLAF